MKFLHCLHTTKKKKNGFTLVELLVVMAIMASLIGLSTALLEAAGSTQDVNKEARDILTSLTEARSYSLNSQSDSAGDRYIYGYIYMLYPMGTAYHGYCIYSWYAPGTNTNPTDPGFSFPGTLSQNLQGNTPPSIVVPGGTTTLTCGPSASTPPNQPGAPIFKLVDNKLFDNMPNMCVAMGSKSDPSANIVYAVYENTTGDVYFFNAQGIYVPVSPQFQDVNIAVDDTACHGGSNAQKVILFAPDTQLGSYYENPFIQ